MVRRQASATGVVAAFGGPVIWAVQFGLLYSANAVACARGFADASVLGFGVVPVAALIVTAIAEGLIGLLWLTGESVYREGATADPDGRSAGELLHFMSRWLNGLSLLAVAWTALPALIVQPCG